MSGVTSAAAGAAVEQGDSDNQLQQLLQRQVVHTENALMPNPPPTIAEKKRKDGDKDKDKRNETYAASDMIAATGSVQHNGHRIENSPSIHNHEPATNIIHVHLPQAPKTAAREVPGSPEGRKSERGPEPTNSAAWDKNLLLLVAVVGFVGVLIAAASRPSSTSASTGGNTNYTYYNNTYQIAFSIRG